MRYQFPSGTQLLILVLVILLVLFVVLVLVLVKNMANKSKPVVVIQSEVAILGDSFRAAEAGEWARNNHKPMQSKTIH